MFWFYLVIVGVIFLSFATLLQRVLMKEEQSDPVAYAIVFQLSVSFVVSIYAFYRGFRFPPLQPFLPCIGLMTALYGFGNIAFFRSFQLSEASEVSVISSSRSLWTLLVAILFLGESLTSVKLLGTFLVVLGVALVSWKPGRFKLQEGYAFALLASVLFGIALANDMFLLRSFDLFSYTTIAFLFPAVFLILIKPKSVKKIKLFFDRRRLVKMVVLAIVYGGAALAMGASYQAGGEASQIAPITQSSVILTVLLAAVLLKERSNLLNKIAGAIAVFLGVVLLK